MKMHKTIEQYKKVIEKCRVLFQDKASDYGCAWRVLRLPSLTDQISIKAYRIRTLQDKGIGKVDEGQEIEFLGIINYSLMALIQIEKGVSQSVDMLKQEALELYDKKVELCLRLLEDKNHDYAEAWRSMRVSSITDLIIQKLLRIKQIEDNKGKTKVSEGVDSNYMDIVNYAVFALILLEQKNQNTK